MTIDYRLQTADCGLYAIGHKLQAIDLQTYTIGYRLQTITIDSTLQTIDQRLQTCSLQTTNYDRRLYTAVYRLWKIDYHHRLPTIAYCSFEYNQRINRMETRERGSWEFSSASVHTYKIRIYTVTIIVYYACFQTSQYIDIQSKEEKERQTKRERDAQWRCIHIYRCRWILCV